MKSMELFKQIKQTAHKQLEQIKNEMNLHEDDQIVNEEELYSGLISGRALEACNDDSYVIRIGGKIYQSLEIISEYIGSVYMYEYKGCSNPQIVLFIMAYNIQRLRCQKQDMEYIDNGCLLFILS